MSELGRRRAIEIMLASCMAGAIFPKSSFSDTRSFDLLLRQIEGDPVYAISSGMYREQSFQQPGPSTQQRRRNSTLPRRWRSDKLISDRAIALIIAFEVTSEATYNKLYERPYWPKGDSGVTVAIGYDLGYQSDENIQSDWYDFATGDYIVRMQSVRGIKGVPAKRAAASITDVRIPWNAAYGNFTNVLKFYAGQTIRYFPNSEELSEDSFGALVSLVYNRGSSTKKSADDPVDRRREMREIKSLIEARDFSGIPAQIVSMKRLWEKDPNAAGLLRRRDLEAELFLIGLQQDRI